MNTSAPSFIYTTAAVLPYPAPEPAVSTAVLDSDFIAGAPENFPVTCFPPFLQLVAKNLAVGYQAPFCMPAMASLAVISGAVGSSVTVCGGYKDKVTRLNLFVIAGAERGSGKGNCGEILMKPMIDRSKVLADEHQRKVAAKRGELGLLRKEVARVETDAAKKDGKNRTDVLTQLGEKHARIFELERESERHLSLWIGDATSEATARALEDNGEQLLSFSTEAGAIVKVALGKYTKAKEGDFDMLLCGYSGDSLSVCRVGRRRVDLQKPCLSLLWFTQPCVIRQLVGNSEAVARGLTARPLIFDTGAQREIDDRKIHCFNYEQRWKEMIDRHLNGRLAGETKSITCTPEAVEVFAKFHDESVELERGRFVDLSGELSRWRENAIKVAGLFAVADEATCITEITEDLASRAVAVVRWCGFSYLRLLQSGRRERQRELRGRVLELLSEHQGSMNVGELARRHGIKRPELDALVNLFPTQLTITKSPQVGPGRPAETLRLVNENGVML